MIDDRTVLDRTLGAVLGTGRRTGRQVRQGNGWQRSPLLARHHGRWNRFGSSGDRVARTVWPETGRRSPLSRHGGGSDLGGTGGPLRRMARLHRLAGHPGHDDIVAAGSADAGRQGDDTEECGQHSGTEPTHAPASEPVHPGACCSGDPILSSVRVEQVREGGHVDLVLPSPFPEGTRGYAGVQAKSIQFSDLRARPLVRRPPLPARPLPRQDDQGA